MILWKLSLVLNQAKRHFMCLGRNPGNAILVLKNRKIKKLKKWVTNLGLCKNIT